MKPVIRVPKRVYAIPLNALKRESDKNLCEQLEIASVEVGKTTTRVNAVFVPRGLE